jgi:hypothetical protein
MSTKLSTEISTEEEYNSSSNLTDSPDCSSGDENSVESANRSTRRGAPKKIKPEGWEEERRKRQRENYAETKEYRTKYKAAYRGQTRVKRNQASMHTQYLTKYLPGVRGHHPISNLEWFDYEKAKITLTITQPTRELILMIRQFGVHISETNSGVYEP